MIRSIIATIIILTIITFTWLWSPSWLAPGPRSHSPDPDVTVVWSFKYNVLGVGWRHYHLWVIFAHGSSLWSQSYIGNNSERPIKDLVSFKELTCQLGVSTVPGQTAFTQIWTSEVIIFIIFVIKLSRLWCWWFWRCRPWLCCPLCRWSRWWPFCCW